MMKSYLLGIDIGTRACKVAIFDRNGKVLAAANGDYPVYYPHEGWAEQNPEEWWDAVCLATKENPLPSSKRNFCKCVINACSKSLS